MSEINNQTLQPANHKRPDYENQILDLIQKTLSPKTLREELEDYHANDIADAFTKLDPSAREKLFRLLDAEHLAQVIPYLDEEDQVEYLNTMNIKKALAIIDEMEPQDAAELLKHLNKTRRDVIFELLDADTRRKLKRISAYSEDEIGSQMSTDFIEIPRSCSIKDAMRSLRDRQEKAIPIIFPCCMSLTKTTCIMERSASRICLRPGSIPTWIPLSRSISPSSMQPKPLIRWSRTSMTTRKTPFQF